MKCLRCSHDSKYSERAGGRCPRCKGQFAFEPRTGDLLTDRAFAAAIDAVSAKDSLFFNPAHLYYEVCRRVARRNNFGNSFLALSILLTMGGIFLSLVTESHLWPFALPVLAAGIFFRVRPVRFATVRMPRERFDKLLAKWTRAHGPPAKMITRPEMAPLPPELAADIGEFSFDRAVICDRAGTVDLLLANNFHFENNCAVLAADGYPKPVFSLVKKMLGQNPRLEVYALHDATPAGCRLAFELANSADWFQPTVTIVDVGLRPNQAAALRGLWLAAAERVPAGAAIRESEATWLSSYRLELAAVRPEQVLKRMYRAITRRIREEKRGGSDTGGASVVVTGEYTTPAERNAKPDPEWSPASSASASSQERKSGLIEDTESFSAETSSAEHGDAGVDGFG